MNTLHLCTLKLLHFFSQVKMKISAVVSKKTFNISALRKFTRHKRQQKAKFQENYAGFFFSLSPSLSLPISVSLCLFQNNHLRTTINYSRIKITLIPHASIYGSTPPITSSLSRYRAVWSFSCCCVQQELDYAISNEATTSESKLNIIILSRTKMIRYIGNIKSFLPTLTPWFTELCLPLVWCFSIFIHEAWTLKKLELHCQTWPTTVSEETHWLRSFTLLASTLLHFTSRCC